MAGRPIERGLPYFPYNTSDNRALLMLTRKFKANGLAVYISLLKRIYGQGYFWELDSIEIIDICIEIGIEENVFFDILNFALYIKIFNNELYAKFNILTSEEIQLNYLRGSQKRTSVFFEQERC